jgi:hypothetical protein
MKYQIINSSGESRFDPYGQTEDILQEAAKNLKRFLTPFLPSE